MKNKVTLLAFLALILLSLNVNAQLKFGHIESQQLITAMPEFKTAQEKMKTEQSSVETELTSLNEQFKNLFTEYNNNVATYTDAIRATKEQELQDLQQRVQRFQEVASQNLEKKNKELMEPIITKATNAIKAVGEENGFTYIYDMSSGVVVYTGKDAVDVLPLVKKKLGIQ